MGLIDSLMAQTGISEQQAKGGAGMLLRLAKDNLSTEEYGRITEVVPEADALVDAAPKTGSGGSGGILGALGGITSAFGGKSGGVGNMAELAQGFSGMGLDTGTLAKFVPVVMKFFQYNGGDSVRATIEKVVGSGDFRKEDG